MLLCMDLIGYHGAKVSGPLLRNHDFGGKFQREDLKNAALLSTFQQ